MGQVHLLLFSSLIKAPPPLCEILATRLPASDAEAPLRPGLRCAYSRERTSVFLNRNLVRSANRPINVQAASWLDKLSIRSNVHNFTRRVDLTFMYQHSLQGHFHQLPTDSLLLSEVKHRLDVVGHRLINGIVTQLVEPGLKSKDWRLLVRLSNGQR